MTLPDCFSLAPSLAASAPLFEQASRFAGLYILFSLGLFLPLGLCGYLMESLDWATPGHPQFSLARKNFFFAMAFVPLANWAIVGLLSCEMFILILIDDLELGPAPDWRNPPARRRIARKPQA